MVVYTLKVGEAITIGHDIPVVAVAADVIHHQSQRVRERPL